MPPTRGISCLSLVLYGIRIGSEGLDLHFIYIKGVKPPYKSWKGNHNYHDLSLSHLSEYQCWNLPSVLCRHWSEQDETALLQFQDLNKSDVFTWDCSITTNRLAAILIFPLKYKLINLWEESPRNSTTKRWDFQSLGLSYVHHLSLVG